MTVTDPTTAGGTVSPIGPATTVVLGDVPGGIAYVPATTPLIGLNYYDGRFLRADDLNLERRGQRTYVEYSNRAGGPGVVHGFDVSLVSGGRLHLSDGLAVDPKGRLLFLPDSVDADIKDLISAATSGGVGATATAGSPSGALSGFAPCDVATVSPTVPVVAGTQLYLVALAYTEGLCGNAEVFGRLCDDACITATDRPYVLDGVVLLLVPLALQHSPATSSLTLTDVHLRSRVASAYFADEWDAGGSLLSGNGLRTAVWCRGAPSLTGDIVPVGVLAWKGTSVVFLDEWTARRERMESPPRRYWQGRMEMRPWPVFLAQVLQFQCQLAEVLTVPPPTGGTGGDPCGDARTLLGQSAQVIENLVGKLGALSKEGDPPAFDLEGFKKQVLAVMTAGPIAGGAAAHTLIDGGIVELPAAGYLPVDPGATKSIRDQVQDLMGAGVDLRLCAVRRDQIAHELERAQHMNRISLLRGLDDHTAIEKVDILVPDGQARPGVTVAAGVGLDLDMAMGLQVSDSVATVAEAGDVYGRIGDVYGPVDGGYGGSPAGGAVSDPRRLPLKGAARIARSDQGLVARLAAIGAADEGLAALLRALVSAVGGESNSSAIVTRMKRIRYGTVAPELDRAQMLARTMTREAALHRISRGPGQVVSLGTSEKADTVAVAASAWTSKDPFAMAVGEKAALSASLDMFVPASPSLALSFRINATFEVEKHQIGTAGPNVRVKVTGSVVADGVNLRQAGGSQAFSGSLLLIQALKGGRPVISLQPADGSGWDAVAGWLASPVSIDARLVAGKTPVYSTRTSGSVEQIVHAVGTQDDQVGETGNQYHDFAVAALGILQGLHPDRADWLEQATSDLFPTTQGPDVDIVASTDWVLFRRRRREDCGDAILPAPAPSRVAAWMVKARDVEQAREIAKMLRAQPTQRKIPWRQIDIVEFEAATATLQTPATAFQSDYQAVGGGSLVMFAGYASNGLGDTVGVTRAQALVDSLAPAATLDASGQIDVLLDPPADQMVAGSDASAFFVTYNPPSQPTVTDCVEVFTVDTSGDLGPKIQDAIDTGDVATVTAIDAEDHRIDSIGSVDFDGLAPDGASLQGLVDAVSQLRQTGNQFEAGYGWIADNWVTEGHENDATDHIKVITKELDIGLRNVVPVNFDHTDACPTRLYLAMRPHVT